MSHSFEKLVVYFDEPLAMCVHRKAESMDQDKRALIVQLCSHAAAMMEDASVPAVTISSVEEGQIPALLRDLTCEARNISALLTAATALAEPFDDSH